MIMAVTSKSKNTSCGCKSSSFLACSVALAVATYLVIKTLKIKYSEESVKAWRLRDYIWNILHFGRQLDSSWDSSVHEGDSKYILTRYLASLSLLIQEDILFVSTFICNQVQYIKSDWELQKYFLYTIAALFLLFMSIKFLLASSDERDKKKNKVGDRKTCCAKSSDTCGSQQPGHIQRHIMWQSIGVLVFISLLISIPWEFVRLYQVEVAKRASAMQVGIPAECIPDQMSVLQSFSSWLHWLLSWRHDPCERYHKILLVDPLWEIPPLLVISSAFTRCILYPLEIFFGAVGRSLRLFFSEIPTPWQPVMMIILSLFLVLLLLMAFGYRLTLPLLLKIEPRTPLFLRLRSSKMQDNKITDREKEKKSLSYSFED